MTRNRYQRFLNCMTIIARRSYINFYFYLNKRGTCTALIEKKKNWEIKSVVSFFILHLLFITVHLEDFRRLLFIHK